MTRLLLRVIVVGTGVFTGVAAGQENTLGSPYAGEVVKAAETFFWPFWPLPGQTASNVKCGDSISIAITLDGNVGPCDDDDGDAAVTIEADGSLDLNGYKVFCKDLDKDAQLPDDGILVNADNTELKNGEVSGCGNGVDIDGSGNRVLWMKSIQNKEDGFDVGGEKNWLRYNTADGNNDDGFDAEESDNTFTGNYASFNNGSGFLIDSDDNILEQNHATWNDRNGFLIDENDDNQLRNNTALYNRDDGFEITGDRNILEDNTAKFNHEDGIEIGEGSNNTIQFNTSRYNDSKGGFPNYDLSDENEGCDGGSNKWMDNFVGSTRNQLCIN